MRALSYFVKIHYSKRECLWLDLGYIGIYMRAVEFLTSSTTRVSESANVGQFVLDPGYATFYNDDDEMEDRHLVKINVANFDAAWKNGKSGNLYIGPNGHGGITNRYEKFGKWLSTANQPIEASTVGVDSTGSVSFFDGRHRYSYLRDHGVKTIMVAMDPQSIKNAKKYNLIGS